MKLETFFIAILISIMNNFSLAVEGENSRIQYNDDGLDMEENIRFFLYTRKTKNRSEQLYVNDTYTLENTAYDVSLPTKFVTHGWNSTYTSDSCATVVQALLTHDDYNVIAVDWTTVAREKYSNAASRVRTLGNYVGKMIVFLQDRGALLEFMSLIGHSMGAHIVGFAGKYLADKALQKVEHIVGLDPAGRGGFQNLDANNRLSRDDAENVQVVHTNMGQRGMSGHVGYSDFYPNGGGPKQPGCPDDDGGQCAHDRSYMYYVESLRNPKSLYAVECGSYDDFSSGKCKTNAIKSFPRWSGNFRGKYSDYMLRTNSKSPYGLGINGTQPAN